MVPGMTFANEYNVCPCFPLCLVLRNRESRGSIVSVRWLCTCRNFFEVLCRAGKGLNFALGKQHPKRCNQPFICIRITA